MEVAKITGVTYRQLDYWVRCGWIPGIGCPGSGGRRQWGPGDISIVLQLKAASDARRGRIGDLVATA
jgi:DNA-binding transcriptional MerR regulator